MKILSLFDGMSVAQQALKDAGIPVDVYYASEIDEYAMAVTQSNFPDTKQIGSVTVFFKEQAGKSFSHIIKNIDLLIGGSPCQDLSIAKKNREGLKGQRSGLFYEYVRIRNEVKPKYFILENVASMPKEAKEQISEILGVQPVMINASLVSAQNRKRLFWVGKWNGEKYEQVEIPQPQNMGILLQDVLEKTIDHKYFIDNVNFAGKQNNKSKELIFLGGIRNKDWANDGKDYSRNFGQGDRVYSPYGKSTTLSALGGGRGAKTGLYAVSGAASRTYPRTKIEGVERQKQIEIRDDGKANAMTSVQGDSMVAQETQIRKLTPVECLRLQSMPDDYFDKVLYKGKPISNTQRYKMCGNAFNKEVIIHILKHLF